MRVNISYMQSKVSAEIAKKLRRGQTPWEAKLWRHLRNRNFYNIKFKRQLRVGGYVYDFGSDEKKILIELDGSGHTETDVKIKDRDKQNYAISQGYKVVRFWNNDIDAHLEGVLETIKREMGL
jgi:ATP-dependent helicase HrpA/adenine-specific DNA-methyltransferase